MIGRAVRVLHISDIHCGHPFVPQHVAAAERLAAALSLDAIVVSGDLSQRAREHEFHEARVVLDRFAAIAPLITVPGNHDTAWWHAPFGMGVATRLHERWRDVIQEETEPTLRVPGVSLIGVNSSNGMLPQTLTWYARDWRVKGGVTDAQFAHATARLEASPSGDLKVLVLHHNVVRGRLSNRWGLARPEHSLDLIAASGAHVVCSGHDHEERVEVVTRGGRAVVVSTANTLSGRMRGHRPSAVNVIEASGKNVTVAVHTFDAQSQSFAPGPATSQKVM